MYYTTAEKNTKATLKTALQRNCRYPYQLLLGEFKEFDINQLYVRVVEL